jgi:hypothetical protein
VNIGAPLDPLLPHPHFSSCQYLHHFQQIGLFVAHSSDSDIAMIVLGLVVVMLAILYLGHRTSSVCAVMDGCPPYITV